VSRFNRGRALRVDLSGEGLLSRRVNVFDPGSSQVNVFDWRRQVTTVASTAARGAEFAVEVGAVFAEFHETNSCRRITHALNNRGPACSVGLVADVMQ